MINYYEITHATRFKPADSRDHTIPSMMIGGVEIGAEWTDEGILRVYVAVDTGEVPAELITERETVPLKIIVNGEAVYTAD